MTVKFSVRPGNLLIYCLIILFLSICINLSDPVVVYSKCQTGEKERKMETNVNCLLCSRNYAIISCFIPSQTVSSCKSFFFFFLNIFIGV